MWQLSILKTRISDSPQEKYLYNDELNYTVEKNACGNANDEPFVLVQSEPNY